MNCKKLLEDYIHTGSQDAFAALVREYVGVVYSSALRQVRDRHLAEDVTQAVFMVLARKAATVRDASALCAWLLATTFRASRNVLRSETRRRRRETEVAAMSVQQPQLKDDRWDEICPLLDASLAQLRQADRAALALRFFESKSLLEVARALGVSEEAARKRVSRALERLRGRLGEAGAVASLATLDGLLLRQATHASAADAAAGASAALSAGIDATTSAGRIARHILRSSAVGRAKLLAGCLLLVASASLLIVAAGRLRGAAPVAGASPTATSQPNAPIKVGLLVSYFTGTGPNLIGKPYGFGMTPIAVKNLSDPQIELWAIIEPKTRNQPPIPALLRQHFKADHVIDATDYQSLRQMDVIVFYFAFNLGDDVLASVRRAVEDGVGFLNQGGSGVSSPGYVDNVKALFGAGAVQYMFQANATQGDVAPAAAGHPLLADLKAAGVQSMKFEVLDGMIGKIEGTPLITADSADERAFLIHSPNRDQPADKPQEKFWVLYLGQAGKGRTVICQWRSGAEFRTATKTRFHLHAVQWLAGRTIE